MVVIPSINGLCRENIPHLIPSYFMCGLERWKEGIRDSFHPLKPMNKGIQRMSGGMELYAGISWNLIECDVLNFNKLLQKFVYVKLITSLIGLNNTKWRIIIAPNPATKTCQILQRKCAKSCNENTLNSEIITNLFAYFADKLLTLYY
jgi:hypothetical protein